MVIHIVTKVKPFENYEQSLLFKFEDLQKSQFLYKDAFEYHQARNLQNEQTLLFHAFRRQMLCKMSLSDLYLSIKAVFF